MERKQDGRKPVFAGFRSQQVQIPQRVRQVSTVCPQTRHLEANARKRPIGPFSKSTERDKAVSAGPRPISGNNNVHTDQPGSVTYCLLLRLTSLLKCMCFACIPIVAPADIAARMYWSIRLDCIFLDSLLTRWKFAAPPCQRVFKFCLAAF